MSVVYLVLLFLVLIGFSNILVRILPLPLPLLQITLGAILAAIPNVGIHISLDPELFLLLFIPPLLFSDGWHISKREFFQEKWSILLLAFGLVFFTVLGAGYFINWMVPVISLPAAFALAAVLSPTDAVAVTAITGGVRIPGRLMHILEGESLLNDASGLVAFKFALAAAMGATFSLKQASIQFAFISVGGLATGVILALVTSWGRKRFIAWKGESGGTHIILSLLLPFASYIIAEHLGWSGILAAVAAGIMMNYTTFTRDSSLETRIQSSAIWGMIEMTFNGAIFILLGLQLPGILEKAPLDVVEAGVNSKWMLLLYVVAIAVALFVLRLVWVLCSLKLTLLRNTFRKRKTEYTASWKLVIATSLAGVRGAVTLAAVLSIPLVMNDGTDFPARNLILFLAAGVILISLLAASFGLPFLLKNLNMPEECRDNQEERSARITAAKAAIMALEELKQKISPEAMPDAQLRSDLCEAIISIYRQRIAKLDDNKEVSEPAALATEIEKQYRLLAIQTERKTLMNLYDARQINNSTLDALVKDTDLREGAVAGMHLEHF